MKTSPTTTLILAHVSENHTVDITGMDCIDASKAMRAEGYKISPLVVAKIIFNNQSYGGWQAILTINNVQYETPVSKRDIKRFDVEIFEPSQESIEKQVVDIIDAVPAEVEVVMEAASNVTELEELDDASNEGVTWMKKKVALDEVLPVRKNSKTYELIVALKAGRMSAQALLDHLYKIGFEEQNKYKLDMALYDLLWKGYQVGKIGKGMDVVYVIRNPDLSPVIGTISTLPSKAK